MKNLTKFILILIIVIVGALGLIFISNPTVDLYIDGENITCTIDRPFSEELNEEICEYALDSMNNISSNVSSLETGVKEICRENGLGEVNVNIKSPYGDNQFPVIYQVEGDSMEPTLQNGQTILVNKTKDIEVNDIVIADCHALRLVSCDGDGMAPEYGNIVKRVDRIEGNNIHLISDNKEVDYNIINGMIYESRGITTWVDLSNIYGVVEAY